MQDDIDSRGMLAAFMQPDAGFDEDEYAPTLIVVKPRNLRHQGFMSGTTMSSGF